MSRHWRNPGFQWRTSQAMLASPVRGEPLKSRRYIPLVAAAAILAGRDSESSAETVWEIPIEGCPKVLIAEVSDEFAEAAISEQWLGTIAGNSERRGVYLWGVWQGQYYGLPAFAARAGTLGVVIAQQGEINRSAWHEIADHWRRTIPGTPIQEIPGALAYAQELSEGRGEDPEDLILPDLATPTLVELDDAISIVSRGTFDNHGITIPVMAAMLLLYRDECLIHFEASFYGDSWTTADVLNFILSARFDLKQHP